MNEKPVRLLIVDDHKIVSDGYKNLLESEGFEVVGCAYNSDQGFEMYKSLKPDVTLLDISMPGKSGLNCIETIIRHDPLAKVIVCTMHDETQIAAKALRCGAKGFITKANSSSIMVNAINQVYKGEYYLGDKYAMTIALMNSQGQDSSEEASSHTLTQLDELSDKEFSIFKMVSEGRKTSEI
ncbi:MAG: response regulator transcription factor, partial [Proteobacteria bacterium]|nr:response regulator transcription factor [Pseudomonadota bacterium]